MQKHRVKGRTQVEIRFECRKLGFAVSKSQFSRILSNPAYIGKVLVRDKKNDRGYYINGIHKPIIALPLFEKIQFLLDGNKKKRNLPKVQTIKEELYLRSHLFCPKGVRTSPVECAITFFFRFNMAKLRHGAAYKKAWKTELYVKNSLFGANEVAGIKGILFFLLLLFDRFPP